MALNHQRTCCGVLLGISALWTLAGCASQEVKVHNIEADAEPIIKQMCVTLDGAQSFRFRVNATMDRPVDTGQLAQFHRTSEITVARPNQLYAQVQSDDGQWTAWYRGKSITILDREANVYATEPVPGRMDDMLDYMADEYDLIMPMADLLVGETYASLLEDVESGVYLGIHAVGDTPCHHLLFRQENLDWQIWIDAGPKALPRKLLISYLQEPGQPQYSATIDGWDLAPATAAETFTFTPPAGAKSVTMSELVLEE